MQMSKYLILLLASLFLGLSTPAWSARIIFWPQELNTGFFDPTPVAPVGGNPGTTLGAQRRAVVDLAVRSWGAQLQSNVTIHVAASFRPLFCLPFGGALGAAGPIGIHANFLGAPLPDVWYVSALADSLADSDLGPILFDMGMVFNGAIGVDPNCLIGQDWYYGLDHNNNPESELDLLTVVMHELAHGFGFAELVNPATGELLGGLPDAYSINMLDTTFGQTWDQLNDAQRLESQVNTLNLVWAGENVTNEAPNVLGPRPSVFALFPRKIKGSYEAQAATFGPPLNRRFGTFGRMVVANDDFEVATDGCQPLVNRVRWRIVLIDRGGCPFTVKVANAQAAGARGVIVVHDAPKGLPFMFGIDPSIRIPSVGVSMADGEVFKKAAKRFSLGLLKLDRRFLAGANVDGHVRLFAPDPVNGSSKSHWDFGATPTLLMEPAIMDDLAPTMFLDLTLPLMQDLGWVLQ